MDKSDPCSPTVAPEDSGAIAAEEPPAEPPAKRQKCSPAKYWCFTWFNQSDDWQQQFTDQQHKLAGYIIGKEICPKTSTPHLQGWIHAAKKLRPTELGMPKKIHWEVARGSPQQNYKYCTKDGDFVTWGTGEDAKPKEEFKKKLTLSPWQLALQGILLQSEPDERNIYWLWEPRGRAGKTSFQKYFISHHLKRTIMLSGKATDMKHAIVEYIKNSNEYPEVIFANIPRSTDEKYISWTGLEEVKDMCFFSGKYEGGQVCGPCPHLVIFANYRPPTQEMSADRWRIIRIPDGKGVPDQPMEADWSVEGPLDVTFQRQKEQSSQCF